MNRRTKLFNNSTFSCDCFHRFRTLKNQNSKKKAVINVDRSSRRKIVTNTPSSVPNHMVASRVSCCSLLASFSMGTFSDEIDVWSNVGVDSWGIVVMVSSSSLESISSNESTVGGTSIEVDDGSEWNWSAFSSRCSCRCSSPPPPPPSSCSVGVCRCDDWWRRFKLLPVRRFLCDGTYATQLIRDDMTVLQAFNATVGWIFTKQTWPSELHMQISPNERRGEPQENYN